MEVFVSGCWWTCHQSLAHEKVRVFSDSVLSFGKTNKNPESNTVWEQIDVIQEFITIQSFGLLMVSQWKSSGRIHHIASPQSPRSIVKIERKTRKILQEGLSSCDVQWHLMGIKGRRERCYSNAQLASLFAKRSGAGQLSFFGLGSEKVAFFQWRQSTKWMGQNGREDDVHIRRKETPFFRATSPLSRWVL